MNAYSRTMPMPGVALPVRERGASALDHRVYSWPAPQAADMMFDPWGAPVGIAVIRTGLAAWPAPDPIMRFDLPAPVALNVVTPAVFDVVDPLHRVAAPDVVEAARVAYFAPVPALASIDPIRPGLRAPTLADAAIYVHAPVAAVSKGRRNVASRLAVSLAGVAGAAAALLAVAIVIF